MRALTFTKYGKTSEVLRVDDVPAPTKADVPAGFVLIKVRAASLNPVDKMRIEGKLATTPELRGFPAVVGYDVAGTVEALGEGVKGFKVGAAVAARMQSVPWQGCCAEYCVVKADKLALKPRSVSFGDAAAVGLAGQTALQALRAGGVGEGSKVLVTGGAGGVGTLAIQLAKILGASTVATTASMGEKAELCSKLGADVVIDYKEQKFEDELSGFDFALDLTGEAAKCAAVLKPGSKVISVTGMPTASALESIGVKVNCVTRCMLGMATGANVRAAQAAGVEWVWMFLYPNGDDEAALLEYLRKRKLKVVVDGTYPLEQAADAAVRVFSGRAKGKVVVTVG